MAKQTKPLMSAKQSQEIRRKARTTAAKEHEKDLEAQKKRRAEVAERLAAGSKAPSKKKKSADGGGDGAPDDGAKLDAQKTAKKSGSKREG